MSKGMEYWIFVPRGDRLVVGTSRVGDAKNKTLSDVSYPNTRAGFSAAEDYVLAKNQEIADGLNLVVLR
jgi:hypothetical protein